MKPEIKSRFNSLMSSILLLFVSVFIFGAGMLMLLTKLNVPPLIAGLTASQLSLLLYFLTLYNFDLSEIKLLKRKLTWKHGLTGILAVIPIMLFNFLMSFIIKYLELDTTKLEEFTADNAEAIMNSGSVIAIIILPLIVAPIIEELVFRAGLKHMLVDKSKWKPIYYVIISSLLFGFLHWQPGTFTIFPILITGFLGVVNSISYLRTNNIIVPIITHMAYNAIILLLV